MANWIYKIRSELQSGPIYHQQKVRLSRTYRQFNQIIIIRQIHTHKPEKIWDIQICFNELSLTISDRKNHMDPVLFDDVWNILLEHGAMLLKGPDMTNLTPSEILLNIRNQALETKIGDLIQFRC